MSLERRPRHSVHVFAGAYLERRAEARETEDWWRAARADEATLYVAMHGTRLLMHRDSAGEPDAVRFLQPADPRVSDAAPARQVLLGWLDGRRCVLVDAADDEAAIDLRDDETYAELRACVARLPERDAGLAAYARALAIWRSNHRYCGRCGAPTAAMRAGHVLRCTACGRDSFPRIDPAIIVLVTDGERALLGRQASWPPGRYSTIAGFVEPGEALEDAVRREVLEEAGIDVTEVHYHSSQPWPFPSSLMLGFEAVSPGGEPHAHDGELEDVRWFTREAVRAGTIGLPPAESISRRLIEDWLADGAR